MVENYAAQPVHTPYSHKSNQQCQNPANHYMLPENFVEQRKYPLHYGKFHPVYPVGMGMIVNTRFQYIHAFCNKVVDNRLRLRLSPYMHTYQVAVQHTGVQYQAQQQHCRQQITCISR